MSTRRRESADERKFLNAARSCKELEIAEMVESRKVNLDVADENGSTAVHFSCKAANHSSLAMLLENGARTDVFDNRGMAPLHCAAEKDYVETMALIIAYAGNIDMRNKLNGKTALHLACEAKKTRAARFLLCCGADTGVQDKAGKRPDLGSVQVTETLKFQQIFKESNIKLFGKMMHRMEKYTFSEVGFSVENTAEDAREFSFFCRLLPIGDWCKTDAQSGSSISKRLEAPDVEATSHVFEYLVNQTVSDVTVTIPIFAMPNKFDETFVKDSKDKEYKCLKLEQTVEGYFLVARMTFEVEEEHFISFIVLRRLKTDRYTVTGSGQTLTSTVEDGFVVHLQEKSLPKDSIIELKVLSTTDFHGDINTEHVTHISNFYDVQIESKIRKPVQLFLPCPSIDRHDQSHILVYNAQGERTEWRQTECEIVNNGRAVKVLDKSVNTGTCIVAGIPQEQKKSTSSWVKDFFTWLFSNVFTRTKSCCFLALTKPVSENSFRVLVILTEVKQSDSVLKKWKAEHYITQMSQKTSSYLCKPGKVFGASIYDSQANTVLAKSPLDLWYYSGVESYQEFVITGHEHDLVIIIIRRHEKQKSGAVNVHRDMTQINVELLKKVKGDMEPRVTHKFDEYPDDSFLSWLAGEIGHEWAMIGIGLGLNYSYLELIEWDNLPGKTNLTMLYTWREDNNDSADLGITELIKSLTITGRMDLVTQISKQIEELMKKSPAERLCKWVRYRQDIKHNHELDGTTSKGYESEGFSVSCLIDNSETVSPFDNKFLLMIVKIIYFNVHVLVQLNMAQDRINDIKQRVSDSTAAMFKCLIIAKRSYQDESIFYDDMLKALKYERNNQAVSEIKELCLNWIKGVNGPTDDPTKKLQDVLRKYQTCE